jgi:hypothetical protein
MNGGAFTAGSSRRAGEGSVDQFFVLGGEREEPVAGDGARPQQDVPVAMAVDLHPCGNRGNSWPRAQDLFVCSPSARFTRSTTGGTTSPMPVHTLSVTASS